MKRIFVLTALLVSLALLTGCARIQALFQTSQTEEEALPETGQATITLASQSTEELFFLPYAGEYGVNPFACSSQVNRVFLPLVYEGLFTVSADFTAENQLCESYTVSDDGTAWAFTLRTDAVFRSGAALTAEDVVYSLNYARDSERYTRRLSCIQSVQALEGKVLITLYKARDQFPLLLDVPIVRQGTAEYPQPDGTGAYSLVLQADADNYLDARADWWGGENQPISRIYLLDCAAVSDVRDSFEYGRISLSCTDPNGEATAAYHNDCEQWSMPTTILLYLGFNRDSDLFGLQAVRQAVTFAIDRDDIVVNCCGGYAQSASLPASPSSPVYNLELAAEYAYSPSRAAQLLEDAGLRDQNRDRTLDLETEDGLQSASGTLIVCQNSLCEVTAARAIADSLNALGLEIQVEALSREVYDQRRANGNYDLYYEALRLTADFDLTKLLGSLGLLDTYTTALCGFSLENLGNFYDLHAYVMDEGALCPVAMKSYAVYSARGCVSGLRPGPDNVFCGLPGITMMGGGDGT